MPTKPRVDFAGYHHTINRGVNRCNIFNNNGDKDTFLKIINKTATIHKVILHDFVLMDNHYHLLIETQKENLSTFMRIINANYAQYFNKRYQRSGHLWQDRYKSKYITSEDYLYTLLRYIENNPIEAGLCVNIGDYPYTFASYIFNSKKIYPSFNESILLKEFDIKTLSQFLDKSIMEDEIKYLKERQKEKIEKVENTLKISCCKLLEEHFYCTETKLERNLGILNAYLDGYTQSNIAIYLNVSKSLISKVIKMDIQS
ncbi:MAG: transposase [Sulfurimonas sp.]|uniref:transposase n=1 Tax=Sulfurimonas sp. TaxID=2022749 RepID=UPI002607F255|nr:transposase [Sulfurimonas sp.]MCW8895993.1 transposase [Sulfurimonas sp.]MCW8954177.1 transposase [Sulfurimonas sp.]MCW9066998.1 transposase [Sulfurimonas sp.]